MNLFVEYAAAEDCKNVYSFGEICVKCGECGRKFTGDGLMITDGKTAGETKEWTKKLIELLMENEEDD